ncbi:MAG: glycoside hydrolase family 2 TIM barrel-domain containing protein [Bryobacteraceae bacterium]|nr:glycoside hydrolase family 2 TIM barrel-domain containing protein [Bryobacteraceae bacterium]
MPPRPEYPNPQFERRFWLSLNGDWRFDFDDASEGLAHGWYRPGHLLPRSIRVPFCFESHASGIADTGFHPVCWYSRLFRVPEHWTGRTLLRFGAVDYRADVWVNGAHAGSHEGGQTPFAIDVSTLLIASGENTVTVRVEDPPQDRSIPRGKQYWKPQSEFIWYTRTSGIWQSVWLESVGGSFLESVRVTAHHDGRLSFEPIVAHAKPGLLFSAKVSLAGEPVWQGMTSLNGACTTLSTHIDDCRPWSPDSPDLYDVTFELLDNGAALDTVQSYFGFRSVEVRDGALYLNNAPLQLRFVLDQGYWPDTLLTPPSDEAILSDIRSALSLGFNGVRKHQKVEDPRFLYWADRLGLLVSGEIGNACAFTPQSVARLTREWTEVIERDYNHPSIIMWIPLNESWGVPDLRDPRQQNHLRAMYALTKSLDATRLVIDNDGWEHTEMTDLFGVHDYTPKGADLAAKYQKPIEQAPRIPTIARPSLVKDGHYNGAPLFLSEFGGVAYVPPRTAVAQDAWGYYGVECEYSEALARIRDLLAAAARLPGSVGFCYTQLTDVEQEINGLFTYDRRPKFDPREIRAAMGVEPIAEIPGKCASATAA